MGLPTTSACIAALSFGFLPLAPIGMAAGLVGLAALMVSPLPYPTGTRVVAVPVVGWVVGAFGIVGVVDIGVCAVIVLVVICVVLPLATARLDHKALTGPP